VAVPLMAWAGLLLLRPGDRLSLPRRAVLFVAGTALAITLFVELYTLEGDRMNTMFKFYIQAWVLLSVIAGAALAWIWAALPGWTSAWRAGWSAALLLLFAGAALYTFTATSAKIRDRFPFITAAEGPGCAPIAGMPLPYQAGLPPAEQPHSLYGLDYMNWAAYCDAEHFLPLTYDHDAIRWIQDNVQGSPVLVEAHAVEYRMGGRYAWNTGLPDVIGWNWHTRQHNAVIPTDFVWRRVDEVGNFYTTPSPAQAVAFLEKYGVGYVVVGPMERAYYGSSGGLDKFVALISRGTLRIVYQNPGVTIYQVAAAAASQ
jgi:uncharacterized membrane protein